MLEGKMVGFQGNMWSERKVFVDLSLFLRINANISQPVLNWSSSKPEIFYPVFFIITYQIADMFDNSRRFIVFLNSIFQGIIA